MFNARIDYADTVSTRLMLRTDEVCRLLGWSKGQLYMAVRRGQIPAHKLGRRVVFLRTELEAHLAQLPHVIETNVVGTG